MGVRLYPNTENPAVLEKLARVPSGTMRRLNSLKAEGLYPQGCRDLAGDYDTTCSKASACSNRQGIPTIPAVSMYSYPLPPCVPTSAKPLRNCCA